ncbi:MAG: HD domain-containing protein [Treponema sp.]|jgi:HD superfamily phosphohydrolase|nr:HD domain-containing protein [Treponema sp.]
MTKTVQAALTEGFTDPVRDVLWGHIYLSSELAALTASAPFMRLHRILQLGPVFRAYPGATHTRASHSIGVYHLGRRLLQNLTERGAAGWLSFEGVRSFLCACLLHDLGHFPYTHSLKELPLRSHESLTGEIILKEPVRSLVGRTGADPRLSAAIVDKELSGGEPAENAVNEGNADVEGGASIKGGEELQFYRKLLSGCLDPDKLDYLNRDARYCGVPYGIQDADFILSRLYPHPTRGADIDSRLIPNVEAILFSKYLMYRTVYWHRQVRSATAMVKKALLQSLEAGLVGREELYNLDDQSLFALLQSRANGKGKALAEAVREGRIYVLAAEIPFQEESQAGLRDIRSRSRYEEQLASELRSAGVPLCAEDVIIDVPEPASFETGLFVLDEGGYFADSSSAFKAEMVNAFVQSLYTVRVFVNPLFEQKVKKVQNLHRVLKF